MVTRFPDQLLVGGIIHGGVPREDPAHVAAGLLALLCHLLVSERWRVFWLPALRGGRLEVIVQRLAHGTIITPVHRGEHAVHERTLRILAARILRCGVRRPRVAIGGRQCFTRAIPEDPVHFQPAVFLERSQGMFGLRTEFSRRRLQWPTIGAPIPQLVQLLLQVTHRGTGCRWATLSRAGRSLRAPATTPA